VRTWSEKPGFRRSRKCARIIKNLSDVVLLVWEGWGCKLDGGSAFRQVCTNRCPGVLWRGR
jgi:hypothetical protein